MIDSKKQELIKKAKFFLKGLVIFLCLLFISNQQVKATHIVGGDITYTYLGSNNYRINLNLFIDCINGSPQAISGDEFAIIGVFDNTGILVDKLVIKRNPPVRFQKLNYNCVTTAPNQCVDYYVYSQVVNLPNSPGGYTLAFQRCCRNNSILNLIDPGGTGATYWTKIPDVSTFGRNSSPVFDAVPPNFLCTNAPFSFLHSATDPDGDSLVYELYQPYDGGDDNTSVPGGHPLSPRPDPPLGPPYNNIQWINPYGTNDMMKGSPILTMDPKTGQLYVVPNTVGQFVVGFKVKEYRNGVLIGETLRDFQFNVLNCVFEVVSRFDYDLNCDNEIEFTNESFTRDINDPLNYKWNIKEGANDFESTLKDINYGKINTGDAYVELIAKNSKCTDTLLRKITVPPIIEINVSGKDTICADEFSTFTVTSNVPATFQWPNNTTGQSYTTSQSGSITVIGTDGRGCKDAKITNLLVNPLPVNDLGDGLNICREFEEELDAGNPGATYKWNTGETTRTIKANKLGKYSVEVNLKGCIRTYELTFTDTLRRIDLGPDSILYCNPTDVILDPGPGFARYTWQDGAATQIYLVDTTGIYEVEVEDEYSCLGFDTAVIKIVPFYDIELGDGENICKPTFSRWVDASRPENQLVTYKWSTGINDTNSSIEITKPGKYWVDVTMDVCTKTDTIEYTDTSFVINLADDTFYCSDDIIVTFDAGDYVSYLWHDGSTIRTYESDKSEQISVQVVDSVECLGTGEYDLKIFKLPHPDFTNKDTTICVAEDLVLDAGSYLRYLWSNGSTDRTIATRKEGPNWVTMWDENGCSNTDTINLSISKDARHTDLFIPNAFTPNGDGLNESFPYDWPIEDRKDFSLMIFTRWGEKVFESNDPTKLWDGSIKNEKWKHANTFVYIIQWRACDGKLEFEKGLVMLLR